MTSGSEGEVNMKTKVTIATRRTIPTAFPRGEIPDHDGEGEEGEKREGKRRKEGKKEREGEGGEC